MKFYSTNGNSPVVDLREALFKGQAPDKGLYMPSSIPLLDSDELLSLKSKQYHEIAFHILHKFTEESIPKEKLSLLCRDAYDYDVPLERVRDKQYIMRLDRGPTASFKDFAARMMARMFMTMMSDNEKELVILTATSGDTGSAIAHAFHNIKNIKVVVLFPPDEVSNRQRKQMTTLGGNITAIGIDGKFDDCQTLVKTAFADKHLSGIRLTSANSINIGRLLPQIIYYVYAYVRLADNGEDIIFSVPSGNFGNMMGALLGCRMGLPLKQLVIATNANNEVPLFMKTGIYRKISPSRVCISNAMNVGHPSNFARVIDLYGGWMDEKGHIHRDPNIDSMKKELWAISIDDTETRETIKEAWKKENILIEPHGAVGWSGLKHFLHSKDENTLSVSIETAHPAKFPDEIESLLGFKPEIPASLAEVESKDESFLHMPNDYERFRDFLIDNFPA